MANTLTLKFQLTYNPDSGSNVVPPPITSTVTCAADEYTTSVQNVGAVEEAINLGNVAAPGYIMVRNLGPTNFVEFGVTTGVYNLKLKVDETAMFRLTGTTLFGLADTAAVDVQYWLFSD